MSEEVSGSDPGDGSRAGAGNAKSGHPPVPRTAREMLALARTFLERKGLGEARLEADLLVAFALGLDRLGLYMRLDQPIQGSEVDRARDLLVRRGRREPTAYIVGKREFYARDFLIGPGALVPRPETELIVDLAREWARQRNRLPGVLANLALELVPVYVGLRVHRLPGEPSGAPTDGVPRA